MAETTRVQLVRTDGASDLSLNQQVGDMVIVARNALRKGNVQEAKEKLKEVFALVPGHREAIDLLGDALLAEGETEKAAKVFERAVAMFPGDLNFEEKLATCHLDLAEMENDKLARQMLLEGGDAGKRYELQPSKAVGLSLLLVGSGQFYNDEVEKGFFFLIAGLIACIGWFWPLMSAASSPSLAAEDRLKFEVVLSSMSGFSSGLFWIMLTMWLGVYVLGAIDAGMTASRLNEDRRRGLGL